jgi:hypothetical protein
MCVSPYRREGGSVSDERVEKLVEKYIRVEFEPRGGDSPFGWSKDAYRVWFGKLVIEVFDNQAHTTATAHLFGGQLRAALQEARREALKEAAELVHGIEQEYIANSKQCDAAGAIHSGTNDIHGALACREIAEKLERLAGEEGTK